MGKTGFFLTSLVAAVPAVFLVVLLVFAFMDGGLSGLLMIMAGLAALAGVVVGVVIPLGILFFGPKAGPKPAKKSKEEAVADDDEVEDFDADEEYDADEATAMDPAYEETVMTDGEDEWADYEPDDDDDEFKA